MRLWHKDLIPYLPHQQLLGQWRECCCIAKSIHDKGSPNHLLVNKIMDYPITHFWSYGLLVWCCCVARGYKVDKENFLRHCSGYNQWVWSGLWNCDDMEFVAINNPAYSYNVFPSWHNDRYLVQCLCNLQEKYDCGGISEDEWMIIANRFDDEMRFCP